MQVLVMFRGLSLSMARGLTLRAGLYPIQFSTYSACASAHLALHQKILTKDEASSDKQAFSFNA